MTTTRNLWLHHLSWGLGLGAAVVLCIQILTWVGLGLSHLTWILTWVLVMVFAVLAGRSLGRRLNKRPRFWQALLLLVVMILVGRVVYQTYMFVYINFVDPTWVDTVAEVWSAQLEEAGSSAEEITENIANFRQLWQTGNVFTLGIVAHVLPQFVLGLLAMTLFVIQPWKKERES
jgi:magnesium-transporting ATPase (P-type)